MTPGDQTPEGFGFADAEHRYRLDARIATGGMGEVWRGTDTTLGREVAIKLLKNEYADDPSFRARFQSEAQHAASLHHANIAAVYDVGEAPTDDGSGVQRPYLVMELVDGQPLSALLRPDVPMDPDAVRALLAQAADGLAAAHAAGIVHRDVKPANLLVTPDRRVKVTDFGIARAAEGVGMTQTGEVMGTPQYLSPEQARGETATPASDVYSLGVVAFECLAGRRPFVADTAVATALAHLREPVPDLPDAVPDDLTAVVRRALAKLPQDRFPDGAALAAALRDPATAVAQVPPRAEPEATQVLSGVVPPPPAPVPGPIAGHLPDPPRVSRRNALWPVLTVIALVVVAVLAFVLIADGLGSDGPEDEPTRSPERSRTSEPTSEPPSSEPTSEPPSSEPTSEPPSSEPTSEPPSSEPTSEPPSSEPPTSEPPASSEPPATADPSGVASQPADAPSASSSRTTADATPSSTPSRTPSTAPITQGEVDRR